MPQPHFQVPKNTYDPRWFIWTITLLLVTGVGLISYILTSSDGIDTFDSTLVRINKQSATK